MQKVVGVKKAFDKETYYFFANDNVKIGDKVVISLDEFVTVATVKSIIEKVDKFSELAAIKRVATDGDLKKFEDLSKKAMAKLPEIKTKSLALGLQMKFVGAEYSLDNSKIVIIFSSEDRVDFRQFLKELAGMLKTRIELKQIGQRDEVKVCGGVGPCGEPCCCARFLKDFEHVSVKMAKTQGLSLSPTKINGICGRLMCCLGYESSQYDEILKKMPKVGSEISTPNGKGTVVYNDILRERVSVKRAGDGENFVVEDFALEELSGKPKAIEVKKEEKPKADLHENFAKASEQVGSLPQESENPKPADDNNGNEDKAKKRHKNWRRHHHKSNKNKV